VSDVRSTGVLQKSSLTAAQHARVPEKHHDWAQAAAPDASTRSPPPNSTEESFEEVDLTTDTDREDYPTAAHSMPNAKSDVDYLEDPEGMVGSFHPITWCTFWSRNLPLC